MFCIAGVISGVLPTDRLGAAPSPARGVGCSASLASFPAACQQVRRLSGHPTFPVCAPVGLKYARARVHYAHTRARVCA